MNIQARFIGEHGSMGFETGVTYSLKIQTIPTGTILVNRFCKPGHIPYASIEAFMRNWTDIVTDKRAK